MKKILLIILFVFILSHLNYHKLSAESISLWNKSSSHFINTSHHLDKIIQYGNYLGAENKSVVTLYAPILSTLSIKKNLIAKVDQRVELLSIIFRLAGNYEYNMNNFKKYNDDIDNYFQSFKNHPVVMFAKELRETREVDFDAVMFMAIHLSQPPELKPLIDFSDSIPEKRWGQDNAIKFVGLLRKFYIDTQFEKFFKNHKDLYILSEKRFQSVVDKIDLEWYQSFYGNIPAGNFKIFIGLNNGGCNYGPKVVFPNGQEELFSIIGTWKTDSLGMPVYDDTFVPTVIHEFNHSFINPLIDAHYQNMEAAATLIFEPVKQQMRNMAYENKTMLKESLVRIAVIKYMMSHGKDSFAIKKMIIQEQVSGFIWMDELYSIITNYENNRNQYPSLSSYFQLIEKYFTDLSSRIQLKILAFDNSCVHVTKLEPFENNALNVDPSLNEIIVHFDKALNSQKYSVSFGSGGKEHYPIIGKPIFSENGKSIKLTIQLKPEFNYSFILTPSAFESQDGYPLKKYSVEFKTGK